jgi:hypothetical protein
MVLSYSSRVEHQNDLMKVYRASFRVGEPASSPGFRAKGRGGGGGTYPSLEFREYLC